ncbi:hypothetical protein D3C86_2111610 [compost metagenome]|jgi:hypothetical protein
MAIGEVKRSKGEVKYRVGEAKSSKGEVKNRISEEKHRCLWVTLGCQKHPDK